MRKKRKIDDLESDDDLLELLISSIKQSDDSQVTQIISLLRSDAPMMDVKASIKRHLVDIGAEEQQETAEFQQPDLQIDASQERDTDEVSKDSAVSNRPPPSRSRTSDFRNLV